MEGRARNEIIGTKIERYCEGVEFYAIIAIEKRLISILFVSCGLLCEKVEGKINEIDRKWVMCGIISQFFKLVLIM